MGDSLFVKEKKKYFFYYLDTDIFPEVSAYELIIKTYKPRS